MFGESPHGDVVIPSKQAFFRRGGSVCVVQILGVCGRNREPGSDISATEVAFLVGFDNTGNTAVDLSGGRLPSSRLEHMGY